MAVVFVCAWVIHFLRLPGPLWWRSRSRGREKERSKEIHRHRVVTGVGESLFGLGCEIERESRGRRVEVPLRLDQHLRTLTSVDLSAAVVDECRQPVDELRVVAVASATKSIF